MLDQASMSSVYFEISNHYSDESDLIDRIRDGDEDACAELVNTHREKMLRVAANILRCEQDSADAVQDAFISAFKSIHCFEGDSRLSTWLHRITVNAALMKLRARNRRRQHQLGELSIDDLAYMQHPACPRTMSPVDRLAQAEEISQMKASIATPRR